VQPASTVTVRAGIGEPWQAVLLPPLTGGFGTAVLFIVTLNEHCEVFPPELVAVKVTGVVPILKRDPDGMLDTRVLTLHPSVTVSPGI
jgi:hypothetical protein